MSNTNNAIILVGFPGIGKTTVGAILENVLPNYKYIDQDMCKCNPREYEAQIKTYMKTHNLILGKCHHNKKTLNPIVKLLNDNKITFKIYNFVPESTEDILAVKTALLERIRQRKNHLSLVMDQTSEGEEKIAKILDGFIASYEKPEFDYTSVDYTLDPFAISQLIVSDMDFDDSYLYMESISTMQIAYNDSMELLNPEPLKKRVLYYAISFDETTNNEISNLVKSKLIKVADDFKLQDNFHITIAYVANGITNETLAEVSKWCEKNLDKEFEIKFSMICHNNRVIAIPVSIVNGLCVNLCPHLTIGVKDGVKPFESNKMLESCDYDAFYFEDEITVTGKLTSHC